MTDEPAPGPVEAALFEDALAQWCNDDLMIKAGTRERIEELFPGFGRVLDWPELRDLFVHHDALANRGKASSRRTGMAALLIAGLGVALLALLPTFRGWGWLGDAGVRLLSVASLVMLCGGTLAGLWHWIGLRERYRWLGHRFWTERLRQLHFQLLISHVEEAAAAVDDDERLAGLCALRRRRLAELVTRMETHAAIRAICGDLAEREAWLVRPDRKRIECDPARLETMVEALGLLRLRVQLDYVGRSLSGSLHAPKLRARLLTWLGDALAIAMVPTAAIAAVYFSVDEPEFGEAWAGVVGALGALGLTSRSIEQGLRANADAERFHWYHAALADAARRFESGPMRARIEALRDVELLAYQELRRFLVTHLNARFLA